MARCFSAWANEHDAFSVNDVLRGDTGGCGDRSRAGWCGCRREDVPADQGAGAGRHRPEETTRATVEEKSRGRKERKK